MFDKFIKVRSVLAVMLFLGITAFLLNHSATVQVSASGGTASVIVELRDDPAAVHKAKTEKSGGTLSDKQLQAYRDQLLARQNEFLNALGGSGVSYTVVSREVKNYDGSVAATIPLRYTLVYNGLALNVPSSAINTIKSMPQVKGVHVNSMLYPDLYKSVDYINAPKVYGAVKELSQFDDLREGYEGQGIYISIIDSGVDWTHPMFGGDPTPPRLAVAPPTPALTSTNKKVVYYLPLTDIAVNDGLGHGTHVASTAAGYLAQAPGADGLPNTADDIKVHGVAPQAKLMSYKVCSDVGSSVYSLSGVLIVGCAQGDTIMALEDSVSPFGPTGQPKPVAHVINMSLGGAGSPDTPTAVAASNAALTGTTVVASAGNSGRSTPTNPTGENTISAPSAGTHVISVGATTHPGGDPWWSADLLQASAIPATRTGAVTPAKNLPAASGFSRLKLFRMAGTPAPPADSMAQRYVLVNNVAGPWPTSVSGRIALVKPQTIPTFAYVSNMAAASGAVGVIYVSATTTPTAVRSSIPSANISAADADILIDAMLSNDNNNVDPPNGTISELPLRMNPSFATSFMGEMGDFSSKGPVRGYGQVKPDISAPGVLVFAAVPPGSLYGGLAQSNYSALSGTSMASPHAAGVAALLKQAHLDWTPDMIRTALINTATNLRDLSGAPKADSVADRVISQGGGLVDVKEAMNAKALMGVGGDGINTPGILGSHSYGEVPVANSRITSTHPVTVTIRDLSGEGGTYNLGVVNSRDLQLAGIGVSLSQQSVSVPANGTATFTVNATFDGDMLRDVMAAKTNGSQVIFELIQMQWYVTARRSDNAESLRMPFYFKPGPTMPAEPVVETSQHTDIIPAGDGGAQRDALGFQPELEGVTYKDVPFNVDASTFRVEALTEWMQVGETGQPDLDYQLLGPDGNVITQSGNGVGPEFVSVSVTQPGTYTHRVIGFSNAATEFTITTTLMKGNLPPTLQAISGDFTNAQGKPVDFDGTINLSWAATNGATGYEIERSVNGGDYTVVASAGAGQTSATLADQPNGELGYRVRALAPGQIGSYVTAPSNVATVVVDRRGKVDITSLVSTAMSNVSFTGGVFKLDLNIKNNSANTYVPFVELNIVRITSASGTVSVKNADNGRDGKSAATAALFGYSNLLGADQEFAPGEVTGNRTLEFNDQAAEMFSFDIQVTAFQRGASGASASGTDGSGANAAAAGSSSESDASLQSLTKVMRITVNPLTKTVTAELL